MKVSSWNIRGCNDPLKLQEITDFLWVNKLDILGVLETKIKQRNYGRIISSYFSNLGSCCNLDLQSNGRILLLWNLSTVVVTPLHVHSQFIHCEVFHNATCQVFHITFVYASNDARERDGLWSHLINIKPLVNKCLILGDFNVIRDISEKIGGTLPDLADIMDFNSCLYQCEVEDLTSSGCDFSWNNKQLPESRVWTKLDRAMANVQWLTHFPATSAHFRTWSFDHSQWWLPSLRILAENQDYCSKQQAKVQNLIHDDCSSKFFYAKIQERKHQQIIGQIKDRHGADRIGLDSVADGFVDYYKSLLGASSPVSPLDNGYIQLSPTVSSEAADALILPITNEEIKAALFTIGSDKSPSPDGFSSAFFKHSWSLIGESYCKAVHSFFSTGRMTKQANSTLIALIPKKKAAFVKGRSIHENIMLSQSLVKGYGRKLQLLNSVVFGIENFWCASVLLPKSVLKTINKLCKNFFWNIKATDKKMIVKSWSSICAPTNEGGFGVKELLSWNKALISKWLWLLDQTPQGLWSIWHSEYHLSHCSIWDAAVQDRYSESFRSIISVKNDLLTVTGSPAAARALLHSWCSGDKFQVAAAYNWFRPYHSTISWSKGLFHKVVVPRHIIITSLACQQKLATVDKLILRGFITPNRCVLCKQDSETHDHLFFACPFSRDFGMSSWSGLVFPTGVLIITVS
ncbi:uncharacterized protein LOC141642861 [Silene latifolia]|uniref:uncharacterized protein LOC141642861 n=1 Tax=Silene latifolia TaxID=37657 RepID=UPI003D77BB82